MLFTCKRMLCSQRSLAKLVKFPFLVKHWKVVEGDVVAIVNGDDKGKIGKIIEADKLRNVVKVKGAKLRKVVDEQTQEAKYLEKFIHYSNVNLLDPVLKLPTRIAVKYLQGERIRISKKSGCVIPFPESRERVLDFSRAYEGPKDTDPEIALKKTYVQEEDVTRLKHLRATMKRYNLDLH